MKISMIQMNSQSNKGDNIASAQSLIANAMADNPDLIVLPECWTCLSPDLEIAHNSAETFPNGEAYQALQQLAKQYNVTIHGGSIFEKNKDSHYNSTVVFNGQGEEIAKYSKIHLFDVNIPPSENSKGMTYMESDKVTPGHDIVTYDCGGITVGCAICYDIRFPEMFIKLRQAGADVIILPAAFTRTTGQAHWEILCRARAIETQTHFVAVGMCGAFDGGNRKNYGNSMVVDGWGNVLHRMGNNVGYHTVTLDTFHTQTIRQNMPIAAHRKLI